MTNSPIIKFIESVKNSLDSFHLCISSLYSSPNVCKNGLDNDFKVKLHALCRELMWDSLKKDFASMDEHVQLVEVYSLTHSLTYLLTYLLTYSLPYLLTYLLTYLLIHSLTHLLTYSLTHSLTYSLTHSLTYSLIG